VSGDSISGPRPDPGLIHSLLDQLASDFAGPPYREQIAAAREEYFARNGKVFEDDAEVYEARLVAFLEWYVLERPLPEGQPPVLVALARTPADAAHAEQRTALARIATSHRSLFDIAEVKGNRVELEERAFPWSRGGTPSASKRARFWKRAWFGTARIRCSPRRFFSIRATRAPRF